MWWTATFDPVWSVSLATDGYSAYEMALDRVDADLVARDPVGLIAAARSDANGPLPWLPYLAAERSVDEFSGAWPEARQRAVTAASMPTHQVKGTRPVIDLALQPLGYRASVVEWFEVQPTRRPNTFRIAVDIEPTREWLGGRAELIRVANKSKNAHTKLEAIEVRRDAGPAVAFVGGFSIRRRTVRVGQIPKATTVRLPAYSFVGAALTRRRTLRVGPRP